MGPPSGALRECQPGSPRVAYRRMSNPVHHAQARVGSTRGERDPLQLVEHSGDAAGVVPAIAHIPGRATHVISILVHCNNVTINRCHVTSNRCQGGHISPISVVMEG